MSRAVVVVVVVVAVLALACGAASQSQSPAPAPARPSSDCGSSITALAGCLTYITPGSPEARPAKDCCAGVKSALGSPAAVACLCGALGQDFGIKINYTRAAALPAACGGDSSALSKCNKFPGASPTGAPAPSSSGSGSGSTPATGTPSSPKSASTRSPVSATLVVAVVAAPLLSYYYL